MRGTNGNQKDTCIISCLKCIETNTGVDEGFVLRTHHMAYISLAEGENRKEFFTCTTQIKNITAY